MYDIRTYLLSVCAAALICSAVTVVTDGKSAVGKLIKLLSGIYLAMVILKPALNLDEWSWKRFGYYLQEECDAAVKEGEEIAMREIQMGLQKRTGELIQSEGSRLGCEISADVICDGYLPTSVILDGAVSPYAKAKLSEWIDENIGITQEAQLWIG